jgi:galactose-1-phosphate uridylyltransferase
LRAGFLLVESFISPHPPRYILEVLGLVEEVLRVGRVYLEQDRNDITLTVVEEPRALTTIIFSPEDFAIAVAKLLDKIYVKELEQLTNKAKRLEAEIEDYKKRGNEEMVVRYSDELKRTKERMLALTKKREAVKDFVKAIRGEAQ